MTQAGTGAFAAAVALVAILLLLPPVPASTSSPAPPALRAGPAFRAPAATGVPRPLAAPETVADRVLEGLRADHVPNGVAYLPDLAARETVRNGVVSPTFTGGPAPDGIATIGVNNSSGTPAPYVLTTSSFLGTLTLSNLSVFYLDNGAPDDVSVQLNTVLANVTLFGAANYTFWTQNVVRYSDRTDLLEFVDNIWNFSDANLSMSPNVFYSTGPAGVLAGAEFYYALGPVLNVSLPFSVQLYANATRETIAGLPYDALWFNYSVVNASGPVANGSYDEVVFNSQAPGAPSASLVPATFEVNGSGVTPTGYLPYDAEFVLAGPGGGSTTSVTSINGSLGLRYRGPGGHYQLVPSAINFGSDTAETIDGLAEYFNRSRTVELGPGPTFLTPFWNAAPTAVPGHLTLTGQVSPAPSFVFVSLTHRFDNRTAQWAPVNLTGGFVYALAPSPYEVEVLLADHDPRFFAVSASTPSTWNLSATLLPDPSVGLTTPLVARSNAQLQALAVSGNGTLGSPYELPTGAASNLSTVFGGLNDLGFPLFPGILVQGTDAPVTLLDPPPFAVAYQGTALATAQLLGLPTTNDLQIEVDDAANVTLWGASNLTGWFSPYLEGIAEADVVVWNSSSVLVGNDTFTSEGSSLLLYGGTGNVVWGNVFGNGTPLSGVYNASAPLGLGLYESGDLVYDNAFAVAVPALSPNVSIYGETLNGPPGASYVDRWNVSAGPASTVAVVNGRNLSGSIVGGTTQGGNYWWTYGDPANPVGELPFNDSGSIAVGGDYLPLFGAAQGGNRSGALDFELLGLAAGTPWNLTVNGAAIAGSGPWLNLTEPPGRYPYEVAPEPGYTLAGGNGTAVVDGGTIVVPIRFTYLGAFYFPLVFEILGYGANVTVTVAGQPTTGAGSVAFSLANGTYPYTVAAVAGYAGPSGGTAVVVGATTIDLVFAPRPATVNGTVAPLSAALWGNGRAISTFDGAFALTEAPGGLTLFATSPGYVPGWLNLTLGPGEAVIVAIVLVPVAPRSPPDVALTFEETGLANGTEWSIDVDGQALTGATANLTVGVPAGTYAYSVGNVPDYLTLSPAEGRVTAIGESTVVPIAFAAVNGTILVRVEPTNASLLLDGAVVPLVDGAGAVSVAAGAHRLVAYASGYLTATTNLSIAPNASVPWNVTLAPRPPGPSGTLAASSAGPPGYALPATVVAAAAVGVVLGVLAGRRRADPPRGR